MRSRHLARLKAVAASTVEIGCILPLSRGQRTACLGSEHHKGFPDLVLPHTCAPSPLSLPMSVALGYSRAERSRRRASSRAAKVVAPAVLRRSRLDP
eukprot:scaffold303243_cov30-Tisochrysis_lutea.AAC.5